MTWMLLAMRRWCWCAIHVVAISSCAHAPRESDVFTTDDGDDDEVTSEDDPYDDDDYDTDDDRDEDERDQPEAPYDDEDERDEPESPYDDEDERDARDGGRGQRPTTPRDASAARDGGQAPAALRDGGALPRDASVGDDRSQGPARDPSARADAGARGASDAGLDAGDAAGPDAPASPSAIDGGASKPTDPADVATTPPADAGVLRSGCVPGTYRGVFNGDISALLGRVQVHIQGDILIDLTGALGASHLQVRSGRLQGTDQSGNPIEARISGRVDCRTLQLKDGQLVSGTYRRRDPIWGGQPITIGFRGVATGTFFDDPASAIGRWEVVNDRGTRSGSGTWTARIQN